MNKVKRSRIANTSPKDKMDRGMVIVLNKSLKEEIVSYARNVSFGVTHFKSSVRTALTNMGSFGLNAMYEGYESAVEMMEEDLANIADTYNRGATFLRDQKESADLRSFSYQLRDKIFQGRDRLGLLGFNVEDESSTLHFDPSVLRSLSQIELHAAIGANMQVFRGLYQSTSEVLNTPLSSHIHFRGLSYHYNYQWGRMVEDGYGMIESGMIVDRVV